MVVIRFSRGGAKGRPFYNIVATDKQSRRDGRFIERLGFYNPIASGKDQIFSIAKDRLSYWQSQGAELSPAVKRLVRMPAAPAA
jgi:small subunit ribosomal protein S16